MWNTNKEMPQLHEIQGTMYTGETSVLAMQVKGVKLPVSTRAP
jgi:hypothetical protein